MLTMQTLPVKQLTQQLHYWYRNAKRDLPWRETYNPYAIWVSEIMLQQTQVKTVLPYYQNFLTRFPTIEALARADEDQVLASWSGLGYYRRARFLHQGAKYVSDHLSGEIPETVSELREIPGIGRYTAGAIASFAFKKHAPIVDGNVKRVLSRLAGWRGVEDWGPAERSLWALAERFAKQPRPEKTNQALMELGALVCRVRNPDCASCPWQPQCEGFRSGNPEQFPAPIKRSPPEQIRAELLIGRQSGNLLLAKKHKLGPLRGRVDLPCVQVHGSKKDELENWLLAAGLHLKDRCAKGTATHGIMNRKITLNIIEANVEGRLNDDSQFLWVEENLLAEQPVSGATWKALNLE